MNALGKLLAGTALAGVAYAAVGDRGTDSSHVWDRAKPTVETLVELRSKRDFSSVPEINPWYRTSWMGKNADKLLDEAADILGVSETRGVRDEIRSRQARIVELRKGIAAKRIRMASLPEKPTGLAGALESFLASATGGAVSPNKETFRAEIAADEKAISDEEKNLKDAHWRFAEALSGLGITLRPEEAESLLTLATGDDIADLMAAFANIKAIAVALQDATIRQDEAAEVAKRYYGIYVVLAEIALKAQQTVIDRIDDVYGPKLNSISSRAEATRIEARKLMAGKTPEQTRALEANVAAGELTLRAAALYRSNLVTQRSALVANKARLRAAHDVAVNTWKTVDTSLSLAEMIRSATKDFGAVLSIELPPMQEFGSVELKREMKALTAELKKP